jgi:hypothetical protein
MTSGRGVILLAVWNGAPFLPAQLASLEDQRDVPPPLLLWRDDGSTDGSPDIVQAWASGSKLEVRRLTEPAGRLGPTRGFMALLAAAPEDADYYAFCDQDDVWLPNKCARAAVALHAVPFSRPAIYCARQRVVDEDLRPLGLSPLPERPPGFANALVQNIVIGCSAALNPAARRLILAAPPPPAGQIHDWWAYLLVTAAGGDVVVDPEPALLYRQHGANSIGAETCLARRVLRAIRRGPDAFVAMFGANLDAITAAAPLLPAETIASVARLQGMRECGPLGRLRLAQRAGLYRQTRHEQAAMAAWFLLGKMPPR